MTAYMLHMGSMCFRLRMLQTMDSFLLSEEEDVSSESSQGSSNHVALFGELWDWLSVGSVGYWLGTALLRAP